MNPEADTRNLRIFSFEVVDRETYSLALENQKGRAIGNNLSLFDLFSFDVLADGQLRLNFEALFQKYEAGVEIHTRNLLAKLNAGDHDVKTEIIDLFAAKLLNFARNPFSIAKVLNSFPKVSSFDPTDPALIADYRRVVSGKKPQKAYLCSQLGISDAQYVEWLRVLFMLLTPMMTDRPNLFEEMIKNLFENRKTHVAAFVCECDNDRCLLSDLLPELAASFDLSSADQIFTAFIVAHIEGGACIATRCRKFVLTSPDPLSVPLLIPEL